MANETDDDLDDDKMDVPPQYDLEGHADKMVEYLNWLLESHPEATSNLLFATVPCADDMPCSKDGKISVIAMLNGIFCKCHAGVGRIAYTSHGPKIIRVVYY